MHASELWNSPSIKAKAARAALLPASYAYGFGWQAYLTWYRLGLKKPAEPHSPVVCVGNLQAGGSGKTPVTIALAQELISRGHQVIVSSSGYGSPRSREATLAPSGQISAAQWGDEAAMMRWLLPDLNLVVGRGRVRAAELVHEAHPKAIMLMDDGFQHLPLKKHLTIVLDPELPPNRFCLPAGPYREPRRNRNRADLLIPGRLTATYSPTQLTTPDGEPKNPAKYSVLCAIGRPDRLLADLNLYCPPTEGLEKVKLLPDHDPMTDGSIWEPFPKGVPIVVTAKDWMKLRERSDWSNHEILIASQFVKVENFELIERHLKPYFA